ncbi:MAG: hypothetical protein WD877_00750 [Candidatus Saccharimonadales bacterium]
MGAGLTSFLLTVGASTWLYTKLQNRSGNNTRQSLVATAVVGVLLFIISFSILSLIF